MVVAGWSSGKTRGLAHKGLQLAVLNAPIPVPIYEPGWKQVVDVIEPELRALFIELGCWQRVRHNRRDHNMSLRINGADATLHLRNASNPDHILGRNDAAALPDEVESMSARSVLAIRSRVRNPRARCRQLVLAGTPNRGKRGVLYEAAEGRPTKGTRVIRAKTTDNPFVDDAYVDTMLGGLSDLERQRYRDGLFVDMVGRVYTQWRGDVHIRPWVGPSTSSRWVMTIDPGAVFTPWVMADWRHAETSDEVVHVMGELLGEDTHTIEMIERAGRWWSELLTEVYGTPITPKQAAREVWVYLDPAGEGQRRDVSTARLLREAGYTVRVKPAHNSVRSRVAAVQSLLAKRDPVRFVVDDARAPYVTLCLSDQEYGDDGTPKKGRPREKAEGLDHGADAIGYFVEYEWPAGAIGTFGSERIH